MQGRGRLLSTGPPQINARTGQPAPQSLLLAPGARVEIRDEEWLVRRVDTTTSGGQQLSCVGLSELVRDKEAVFLTELDSNPEFNTSIRRLQPEDTEFVPDESSGFIDSRLYIESLLRQTPPTGDGLYIGHRAAMDDVTYQLVPALQALEQPRQRILIADAVGLGKTLEAGILCSELMRRGRGKRILVVAVKSMLTQFQKEFWNRFTIPLTRLDSIGIQRVRSRIPTNHNPFFYFDKSIVSVDTLKQGIEYRNYLEQAWWDIIVIDEAHNVAERGSRSQRSRLARLLAGRSDTLIMLSATPHDGRAESFASLLNMLDATAIANPKDYSRDDYADKGLVIRRFKKDIKDQVKSAFQERETREVMTEAGPEEDAAFDVLVEIGFSQIDKRGRAGELFKTTLTKALFSSPAACQKTIRNRIRNLEKKGDTTWQGDADQLAALSRKLDQITPGNFSKYRKLLEIITGKKGGFGWKANNTADRLVIFTERIETLRFLESHLKRDLHLKDKQVEILHGTLSDIEQQRIVEDFGQEDKPIRLLICSDVASEGINLHYLSHRMIHFDIPWSLMVFQQRNGRIDRYGQEHPPQIVYLMTDSRNEVIRGDNRILEVLIRKDEQAVKNIGDPSAFMGVYDVVEEERLTAKAIEAGQDANEFDAQYSPKSDDFDPFSGYWFTGAETTTGSKAEDRCVTMPTLFTSDYDYLKQAIGRIGQISEYDRITQLESDDDRRRLEFTAPQSLKLRFDKLGREMWPTDGHFILSANKTAVDEAIRESRRSEDSWPKVHYLWEQHPVSQWVNDKAAGAFKRQQAPVIVVGDIIGNDEIVYLVSALIPNRKGHPVIHHWLGVSFDCGQYQLIGCNSHTEQIKQPAA